jgi:hypothetical protein
MDADRGGERRADPRIVRQTAGATRSTPFVVD